MATASKEPPTAGLTKEVLKRDAPATPVNGSVRVEIFDQVYNLRGSDADYITQLAEYVDGKMRAVSQQTATVDSVRLAVLAALNIADEYPSPETPPGNPFSGSAPAGEQTGQRPG